MDKLSICILIFALFLWNNHVICKNECKKARTALAISSAEFIHCALDYSEPVTYCEDCIDFYLEMLHNYDNLTTQPDCRALYIDNDRLNIIQNINTYTRNLWNAGHCKDCFSCDPEQTQLKQNCTLSNDTIEFKKNYHETKMCISHIDDAQNDEKCKECASKYRTLNDIYINMRSLKGDKICFDIKDQINKTRIYWSKTLHCCQDRDSSKMAFSILAVTTAITVSVFYLGLIVYGKRVERQAFVQNDLMPVEHSHTDNHIEDIASDNHVQQSLIDLNIPTTSSQLH